MARSCPQVGAEVGAVLFVGDDWAEAHHDIEIVDETGSAAGPGAGCRRAWPGSSRFHALVADHLDDDAEPEQVLVGIETDRGPWVQALLAAGYEVFAVNPMSVAALPGTAHCLRRKERPQRPARAG